VSLQPARPPKGNRPGHGEPCLTRPIFNLLARSVTLEVTSADGLGTGRPGPSPPGAWLVGSAGFRSHFLVAPACRAVRACSTSLSFWTLVFDSQELRCVLFQAAPADHGRARGFALAFAPVSGICGLEGRMILGRDRRHRHLAVRGGRRRLRLPLDDALAPTLRSAFGRLHPALRNCI